MRTLLVLITAPFSVVFIVLLFDVPLGGCEILGPLEDGHDQNQGVHYWIPDCEDLVPEQLVEGFSILEYPKLALPLIDHLGLEVGLL